MLTSSDLIAIGTACLAVNAGFLGILLPLHYSIAASLLASLVQTQPDDAADRIRRYCVTADTLVNLAACVWLANVVIGVCLLGEYLVGAYASSFYVGLFSSLGTLGTFGFPILAWCVIFKSYSDGRRDMNAFCVPNPCHSVARAIAGFVLTGAGLLIPAVLSALLIMARVGQPIESYWRPSDIINGVLLGTLISSLMILAWIVAGYHFRPFSALEELGRRLSDDASTKL